MRLRFSAAVATALLAAPVLAAPLTPNSGPIRGEGVINDNDGNSGRWTLDAVLSGGNFTGTMTVTIRGVTVSGPLNSRQSFLENGRCTIRVEQARNRMEISGPCTSDSISGYVDGFVAGSGVVGKGQGTLRLGKAGAAPATKSGGAVLPTAKLTCAWQERIGGNVAGDLPRYELRMSNMVTLTLALGGTYRTNAASGSFVREGDRIRLTSGAFAGAVGRLEPDRSGQPAVYFERDENRRPNGVHIVDPGRTACTKAR